MPRGEALTEGSPARTLARAPGEEQVSLDSPKMREAARLCAASAGAASLRTAGRGSLPGPPSPVLEAAVLVGVEGGTFCARCVTLALGPDERKLQNLVHGFDRHEAQSPAKLPRQLGQVLGVALGDDHGGDPGPPGGDRFLE